MSGESWGLPIPCHQPSPTCRNLKRCYKLKFTRAKTIWKGIPSRRVCSFWITHTSSIASLLESCLALSCDITVRFTARLSTFSWVIFLSSAEPVEAKHGACPSFTGTKWGAN
eukprot:5981478-Amphidinium_carterae.1